jgi:hypothetical protein
MRAIAILLLAGSVAGAQEAPRSRWHLGVEAFTDFPLQIGSQVWVELPHRIRISTSFGEMPDPYLQTINAILVSAGVYDQSTATVMTEVIDRAFTWRIHVGWRPFKHRGAYFEGGFGTLSLDKGLLLADAVQLATGVMAPQVANIGLGYTINSVVETLGGEVGWIWNPTRGLTLRVSIGVAAAVGAQVRITPNFLATTQQVFTQFAEAYTEDLLKKYLIIPTVGFGVGWQIF